MRWFRASPVIVSMMMLGACFTLYDVPNYDPVATTATAAAAADADDDNTAGP